MHWILILYETPDLDNTQDIPPLVFASHAPAGVILVLP